MDEIEHLYQQLENVCVKTENKTIPIIDTLKKTPRSGKMVRILKYKLDLPFRSLYDHIISLLAQAKFFLSFSEFDLDCELLVRLFAFHDLSETIIGDVPDFTPPILAAETYMSHAEKSAAKKKADQLLMDALPKNLKQLFSQCLAICEKQDTDIYRIFNMVDKTDPIIAIWRYLSLLREKICIDDYLMAMTDFFLNPRPQNSCVNEKSLSILRVLQNSKQAKQYYLHSDNFFQNLFENDIACSLTSLIEDRSMHFVEKSLR